MGKIELLAPAGSMDKLKMALLYGADAVYLGGKSFGLRAFSDNFSLEEMEDAVRYAHGLGKKVHVTVNIFPHNADLNGLPEYLTSLRDIHVDAVLIADPGIFSLARQIVPDLPVHISTQANVTNWASAKFWHDAGAKRVVMAREVSLKDVKAIHDKVPVELEGFVHGAMCISYSGRCLLSNYFTENRDSNRGQCVQCCRFKYNVVEEKRPGQYFPVMEDERGTYIFNSKDLCLLTYLPDLYDAGLCSLKIEGRNKSAYYVAIITNAYRAALDAAMAGQPAPEWALREVVQVSHREYCTGFFYGRENAAQRYADSSYVRNCDVVAVVNRWEQGRLYLTQRNRFFAGDSLEIVAAGQPPVTVAAQGLENEDGESIETANHAMMQCSIACETAFPAGSVVRKPVE